MPSRAEIFGAALGKAIRKTAATMKAAADEARVAAAAKPGPAMVRINIRTVPEEADLDRKDGWIAAQVQLLIDKAGAGAEHVIGRTVLKPGGRHVRHRHHNCEAFLVVLKGKGHVLSDLGEEPAGEGDVIYLPRDCWHGFNNTSDDDVVLLWGLLGAGSIGAAGYEADPAAR